MRRGGSYAEEIQGARQIGDANESMTEDADDCMAEGTDDCICEEGDDCKFEEEEDCESEEEDDCDSEEEDETEEGDILSVEAEDVIKDNLDLIDEVNKKIAATSMKFEKHRLKKEAVSYLREQYISRLLTVADMKARWDNDEYFDEWYENAQDLLSKDPNLDLDTAFRGILKNQKQVLHKQLRNAMDIVNECDDESCVESEADQ
jgi:hypothetical protein